MGISGIGIWLCLIMFAIVLLLFGGNRFPNFGGDVGAAVRDFRDFMSDAERDSAIAQALLEEKSSAGDSQAFLRPYPSQNGK